MVEGIASGRGGIESVTAAASTVRIVAVQMGPSTMPALSGWPGVPCRTVRMCSARSSVSRTVPSEEISDLSKPQKDSMKREDSNLSHTQYGE